MTTRTYRITIREVPSLGNSSVDDYVDLSDDNLFGIAIMASAVLGDYRDSYFEIRDKALRLLDLDGIIRTSGSVVLTGEDAFELDPVPGESWFNTVMKQGGKITQRYSVKVEGYSEFYLLQFNSIDFYQGLKVFCLWIGKTGSEFLRYLHDGNVWLDVDFDQ